jgi:VanZ family protein
MVLIYWLSSQRLPATLHRAPDYAMHFLAYFVMGILTVRAFARGVADPVAGRLAGYSMFFSLAYALSDEWHQMFVPGRVASFEDILADGLGILASLGFLYLFWRLKARLSNRASRFASLETR